MALARNALVQGRQCRRDHVRSMRVAAEASTENDEAIAGLSSGIPFLAPVRLGVLSQASAVVWRNAAPWPYCPYRACHHHPSLTLLAAEHPAQLSLLASSNAFPRRHRTIPAPPPSPGPSSDMPYSTSQPPGSYAPHPLPYSHRSTS